MRSWRRRASSSRRRDCDAGRSSKTGDKIAGATALIHFSAVGNQSRADVNLRAERKLGRRAEALPHTDRYWSKGMRRYMRLSCISTRCVRDRPSFSTVTR